MHAKELIPGCRASQNPATPKARDDGKFVSPYKNSGKTHEFAGDFRVNNNGMWVLDATQSQMVAAVELPQEGQLKFVLPGDPGLLFTRKQGA